MEINLKDSYWHSLTFMMLQNLGHLTVLKNVIGVLRHFV
jgi:hypothetical protein